MDRWEFVKAGFLISTFDEDHNDSNRCENELLHGGEHHDDVPKHLFYTDHIMSGPREKMLECLINQGFDCRPKPIGSTTTNK